MENMRKSSQKASAEAKIRAPKHQRGHDRVAVLTEAAARIFVERGYEAATMTEIAAEANSSIGSLYQFFATKPLLAEALHIDRLERLNAVFAELQPTIDGRPAADIGEAIFDRLGAFIQAYPEFPVLAGRRDIQKDRKARSRAALKQHIAALLDRARPALTEDIGLLSSIVVQFLRTVVAVASDHEAAEGQQLVLEFRQILRRRLEDAATRS